MVFPLIPLIGLIATVGIMWWEWDTITKATEENQQMIIDFMGMFDYTDPMGFMDFIEFFWLYLVVGFVILFIGVFLMSPRRKKVRY